MPNKITSYQTAEFGKFVEITGNTQYPAVSVVRLSYPDTSSAFPSNSALPPVSSVDVYSKYAVLTKLINPEDIKISLSADNINVDLGEIELNTDELEGLVKDSNAELSATRIDMNYQFDETQTILSTLTSIQNEKQDVIITLLDALTSNTDNVEFLIDKSNTKLDVLTAVDYATSTKQDSIISAIQSLSSVNRINGFVIPDYDRIKNYYYGSSNNLSQVDYKSSNTVVASLSFTYVGDESIDNALLNEVIKL